MMTAGGQEYRNSFFPAPCRGCGGPAWMTDEEGAIHPCCQIHGQPCPACHASARLNREQRRRGYHPSRLPIHLLDDKLSVIGDGKSIRDQEVR